MQQLPRLRIFEMRLTLSVVAAGLLTPGAAYAQDIKPIIDARLRYEAADQDGFALDARALTFRLRAGAELKSGDWSLLAEAEAVAPLSEHYDSGLNGRTQYPLVADPENIELNRFQLQYGGLSKTLVTLGRQRINVDDQRFVGSSGWRQNEQTFDAARLEYGDPKGFKADFTYSWSVRTIWGVDGTGPRQQAIGGNNVFANVSYPTLLGTLSGFAFIVDQDDAAVQAFRLSSQTYGVRFAGSRSLSGSTKISYALSYARQSDHHRNPNDYRADYWLTEVGLEHGAAKLGVGYELLGADDGRPLTSFQTPLATLHKFQGWADKFLSTPPNGVRDLYANAGYGWKNPLGLDSVSASLVYHRFRSDRLDMRYGHEWDAQLSAKKGRWTATAKVAAYDAEEFATDTKKLWLQLEWTY
jgi:hypothetical protein